MKLAYFNAFVPGVDRVEIEIDGLGRLTVHVRDPLKRTWPRGIDRAMAERVRSRRLPQAS